MVKKLSGYHLTAFDKRCFSEMHSRGMTRGETKRKRFTLEIDESGNYNASVTHDGRTWRYVLAIEATP